MMHNDGFNDWVEIVCGTDSLLASSKPLDTDNDTVADCIDLQMMTMTIILIQMMPIPLDATDVVRHRRRQALDNNVRLRMMMEMV